MSTTVYIFGDTTHDVAAPFGNQEMLFQGIMLLDYNLVSHLNYGHTDILPQIGGCSLPQ